MLLAWVACLTAPAQAAWNVSIVASGSSSGGAWVGDTWTASATGAQVLASEIVTHLGNGPTVISTGGTGAENGDLTVNGAVAWSANALTLTAARHLNLKASLTGSASASLVLEYGQGAVAAGNTATYSLSNGAKVSLPAGTNFSTKLGSDGGTTTWTVVTALGVEGDATVAPATMSLQGMATGLAGNYVLGADIAASSTATWNSNQGFTPIGYFGACGGGCFTGQFDGLGHTVSGLTIDLSGGNLKNYGMFGSTNNAVLQNVGLVNVNIKGGANGSTGALVGTIYGSTAIRNCYADGGSVSTATQIVGGLVGNPQGSSTISYSYANVSVSAALGGGSSFASAGGLVGANSGGTISYSYATGSVSTSTGSASGKYVGGLAGMQTGGSISNSYATGAVSGNNTLGGLIGNVSGGAAPSSSYWDKTTTGQNGSVGGGTAGGTGLTTSEWATLGPIATGTWLAADWGTGYPYPGIKALPSITLTASASQTYGSAATFGIASILDQNGSDASGLVNTGSLAWQVGTTVTSAAGTVATVGGSGATATGYQLLYTGSLTVAKAALSVTANNASKTYDGGAWSGGNGVAYSGFVNGQNASALSGTLTYGGAAQGAVNPGSYAITPAGLSSSNYNISFISGTLTIAAPTPVEVVPTLIVAGPGSTTTLSGITPVTASPGSTLVIPKDAKVEGVAITLAGASSGSANGPINFQIGGLTLTLSGYTAGTVVSFKKLSLNGVDTLVLTVTSGALNLAAAAGQPLLTLNGAATLTAGTNGGSVSFAAEASGSGHIAVTGGSIQLSSNAFASVKNGLLYAGEIAAFNAAGKITGVRLGSLVGDQPGDPLPQSGKPAHLTIALSIPRLAGTVARLPGGLEQALATALGGSGSQQASGAFPLSGTASFNLLPQGDIAIDDDQPDGLTLGNDGLARLVRNGVVLTLVPAPGELWRFADELAVALPGVSLSLGQGGVWRFSLAGQDYVLRPSATVQQAAADTGFATDADGLLHYHDGQGGQQAWYPWFFQPAGVRQVIERALPGATTVLLSDGRIEVRRGSDSFTLAPNGELAPRSSDAILQVLNGKEWWPGAAGQLLFYSGGVIQGASVR